MAPQDHVYDLVVVGGGPVGWATAYEAARSGANVMLLEQNTFFNQAGSSGDMARMFRTMYTEDFMADLAYDSMEIWNALERDAGVSLRNMSGLLNFGDKDYGAGGPEGTLMGPVKNLERLGMQYTELKKAADIEKHYPFKNLPTEYIGLFAPDNGVINVMLLLRTLSRLAKDYGARAYQNTEVSSLEWESEEDIWVVRGLDQKDQPVQFRTRKVVLACGAYVNKVLEKSFGFRFDLNIWEMVANYWSVNPGPSGTVFPSMWFQFANDKLGPENEQRSQLFYGFPALDWGPPNTARIAVDAATRQITDPSQRSTNVIDPADISDVQEFIANHVVGVDATVPAYSLTCLQTNVFDNMFVLDYIPKDLLRGGREKSVAVFTAGWAMKFVPLLGQALKDMVMNGGSKYALPEFAMTRTSEDGNKRIIVKPATTDEEKSAERAPANTPLEQAKGSSFRCHHSVLPPDISA